ncbi:MAG: M23 family metallopeptidase, partial [Deltaproteobacteria bacterium]|nr:M23 family metallopeptidase [Deltaproteobacteria bacterium]
QPPSGDNGQIIESAGIYVTVLELQAPPVAELQSPATGLTGATEQLDRQAQPGPPVSQTTWPEHTEPEQPETPALSPAVETTPLGGLPVGGQLSQAFGCSAYYTGIPGPDCDAERPWFHDGIDIAAGPGSPVRAALSGTVIFAGPDGDGPACGQYRGYGLGVVVDTGDGW